MRGVFAAAAGALALLGCTLERRAPVVPADLVLRHGVIYTMSPARTWADAVAIRDGRVVYVGEDPGVDKFIGLSTSVIDLGGRLVLPGFQDSHAHPISAGLELGEASLYTAKTPAEVEGTIRAYAAQHPDLPWVRGNGWQLPVFPGANPKRELLDRLVPNRPAFLYAADGHSAWVNSKALELAGITKDTKDPPNGRIERDATGAPSGTLREAAIGLVSKLLPTYSTQERIGAARRALAEANRLGITSITDADAGPEYLEAYRALDDQNQLTARVYAAIHVEDNPIEGETGRLVTLRRRYTGGRLRADQVKFYADGVIEARTAALLAPYAGHGAESGSLNYTPEDLSARITALDRQGFQIHVHAIGDRAIRVTLDALANARRENGHRDARPIVAHIELFDPADLVRFRDLGVIASFQPFWAQADEYIRDLTLPVLGPARSRWLYPIETMLNSGAVVVGGSDWSVSSLNPLDAIQVAITRRSVEEPDGPAWIPEERADLPRLLAAYTINAAYATRAERETGSIEVGKLGDVIVLDQNIFAIPATKIHEARVLLTLVEGHEVYRDSTFARP
ncbi:MAG: amidohydrolase [Gemmatimonadales bacterium]